MPEKDLSATSMAFCQYLKSVRLYSKHTVAAYGRDLSCFIEFCNENGIFTWNTVEVGHVRKYLGKKHKDGLSGRSLQRHLSSIRQYYLYLARFHDARYSSTDGVRAPKARKNLPEILSVKQINHLLDISHIEQDDSSNNELLYRDVAIVEILYGAGLRLAELVALNIADIQWSDNTLLINGKGNRQRLGYFGGMADKALKKWFEIRCTMAKQKEQAVFVSCRGCRISHRAVQLRLKKLAEDKELGVPLYPHMLRHSFATHIMESSNDIVVVQHLLGHASITTTQIYLHLNFAHLAKVYDQAHPRAKKEKINQYRARN